MTHVQLPTTDDGCWVWTGARHKRKNKNYGICNFAAIKDKDAHRVSYRLFKGLIPKEKHILHSCDNPPCVRPDHLRIGTPQDNVDDRENRGRSRHASGEKHGRAKLTWREIKEIRAAYVPGKPTYKPQINSQNYLARKYNVTKHLIKLIIHRQIWIKEPTEDN